MDGIVQMYPASGVDAAKAQGFPFSTVDPTQGQTWVFNVATQQWEPGTAGGGSSVTVSETAPTSPTEGDLWLYSVTAQEFIYYGTAWVETGGTGVTGIGSTDAVTFGPTTVSSLSLSDTVWDDLRFPAQAINPAGAANAPAVSNVTGMLEFSGSTDNVIAGQAQLPHSWKHGSSLHPHLHLIFPTNNTLNSRWKFEYKLYPTVGTGPVYADPYTVLETVTVANPNIPSAIRIIEPTASIPTTGYIGSATLLWRISRLANSDALDNDTSVIVLTEFDIHYEVDKLGSPDEIPV